MLKLLLPPNFQSAAERDAIPVRLELDSSVAVPPAELVPALVLLQRWCGGGKPPPFLQLSKKQMRELMAVLKGQPVFAWVKTPGITMEWQGDRIPAISPFIEYKPSEEPVQKASGPARPPGGLVFRKAEVAEESVAGSGLVIDGSDSFLAISLPSREHPGYHHLSELLKTNGFSLEPSNRKWWLRERHKVLNFLALHRAALVGMAGTELTENFKRNTAKIAEAELFLSAEESRDGYSLTMALRAGSADEESLRSALASGRGYVESGGRVYLLDRAKLQKFAEAQRNLGGDPNLGLSPVRSMRVKAAQVAEASDILEGLSPNFDVPASWTRRSEALRQVSKLSPAPLPSSWGALLRPYQKLGVAWLWYLHGSGLGGILADEMGLGKTLQALGLLLAQCEGRASMAARGAKGFNGARLVVAPASLIENWRREAARFAPGLRVFVHHGDQRLAEASQLLGYDLVITSYGTLTRDRELFEAAEYACVIADEAQHIKNRRSQNAQSLRALRSSSRFLLTGTPLENSIDDLRSLFDFLLPGFVAQLPLGLKREDKGWHDKRLLARTAPYILRRTKRAVATELPEKIEQVLWCEMSPAQASLYRSVQEQGERELLDLETGGANEARLRFVMLTQLLRLRQVCCDPRLLRAVPSAESAPAAASAKVEAFLELVEEAVDDGHRVLVFSQFTSMLALLAEELKQRELGYCYLDGSMSPKARQAEVDRFQGTAAIPLFLLSLKAGGSGLNLTAADTVLHFDPWWNPAAEMQATDRAHRIGQTRTVTSYKLICSGTVEEKVLGLQEQKRALLAEVFEASDAAASKLSVGELRDLLSAG